VGAGDDLTTPGDLPQQFIPARIDDMVQIIAERQPEITRLGRIIAFHVELGAIGVRDAMLLDKKDP